MKKKIVISAIIVFLMLSSVAFAAVNGSFDGFQIVKLKYDGKELKPVGTPGILYKGTTLVPIGLLRNAGFDVTWDSKTMTADVKAKGFSQKDILKRIQDIGGYGLRFEYSHGVLAAESTFYKKVDETEDWPQIFELFRTLYDAQANEMTVEYSNYGNVIGTISIGREVLKQYFDGAINDAQLSEKWKVTGGLFLPVMTSKEIGTLMDRIGMVYMFDKSNKIIGSASGFLLENGLFVTNAHVGSGLGGMQIYFNDDQVYDTFGEYLFEDANTDIFGVYLSRGNKKPQQFLQYSVELPEIGEKVYLLSNPKGLEYTMTDGIVSAVRKIDGVTWIQHTASSESGSSGGALLNERGQVIGVHSWVRKDSPDIKFAVPIMYVIDEIE